MLSCITSIFRESSHRSEHICFGYESPAFLEFSRELEELRRFSFNSVIMFLGVHLIAGSKELGPLTHVLLIYTISLQFAVNASFLRNCPRVSRLLHLVPFVGIACMAIAELIMDVQSPVLAAGCLLAGSLPLLIKAVCHIMSRVEVASMALPVRLREVPLPSDEKTTV